MAAPVFTSYNRAKDVTKSDSANFDRLCDAIYVGGAGVVVVVFEDASTASFTAVAGQYLYVRAIRVNSTNTTATLMLALNLM